MRFQERISPVTGEFMEVSAMLRNVTTGWKFGAVALAMAAGTAQAQCVADACPDSWAGKVSAVKVRLHMAENTGQPSPAPRAVLVTHCPPEEGSEGGASLRIKDLSKLFGQWRSLKPDVSGALVITLPDGEPRVWRFGGANGTVVPTVAWTPLDSDSFAKGMAYTWSAQPGSSVIVMSRTDDSGTVTVTIRDGDVQAEVNGKPIPANRVKRLGDNVVVEDEHGGTLATFTIGQTPAFPGLRSGAVAPSPTGRARMIGPNVVVTEPGEMALALPYGQPQDAPPVMIGITMAEVPESLAEHLGLQPGEGFVLERVIEGLPAAKAGLQRADVVVKIDGAERATQEELRGLLRTKKPGDVVKLVVVRRGQKQEVEVKLEPYQAEKLGVVIAPLPGDARIPGAEPQFHFEGLQPDAWLRYFQERGFGVPDEALDHARKALEEALKQLRSAPQPGRGAVDEARKAVEEAMRELSAGHLRERAQRQMMERAQQFQGLMARPAQPTPHAIEAEITRQRAELEQQRRAMEEVRAELRDIKAMLARLLEQRQIR